MVVGETKGGMTMKRVIYVNFWLWLICQIVTILALLVLYVSVACFCGIDNLVEGVLKCFGLW